MLIQRKVEKIIDGNTFLVDKKIGKTKIIRLAGIDQKNLFNNRDAINRLNRLIGGKIVTIIPVKKKD